MVLMYDQEKYVETTKGIVKEFIQQTIPEAKIILGELPNADDNLNIDKPNIYIEYERDLPIDRRYGYRTGRGGHKKRHRITYSFQIITQGDTYGVMDRDRIVQKIVAAVNKDKTSQEFAQRGLYKLEGKFVSSYRVRENLFLARVEINFIIHFES
ncbi:hypothetical protein vBBak6_038 [Bacillus phage v_B-Bak6]|uniref:Uncharacterized protein n=2 Tax=Basiliskvirus TaxID=3044670 RepID=A0A385IK11_9CAUD|nr:hypothetical protein [Bacillus anthracis]YP_010656815.1 tail length tape measure protein [Bacillus phage Basilisk]YP_010656950.1 tail length tape measure protein [Bacillus phage v_B-Bak10]AXY82998.1 hypothetical protein vBBak1_038 [Bacillus phage v_B-Bak1]AXY83118.1 hypothetical protein vBBak6_038 [Bacillus phage v_B-Bak6]AGR46590.1 hypothetical protein BASILISK_46 [Bacillus phage Basilisk]AXY83247.1 hypothetical protein vBBBak10_043 [Bacillus phage v_B-Bak10]PTR88712.1 hypothetical prote